MQSHEEERRGTELYEEAENRVVSYLQQRFLHRLKPSLLDDYGPELLHRLCGIIETNFMVIEQPTGVELSGLFRQACMMEHACQPNCDFLFDRINKQIAVRAGCDLRKGEHLRITYTNILWGTQLRQQHLRLTKHFGCQCSRCLDPTEYGTYISALACLGDVNQTCSGTHLPVDPLDEKTQWKCNSCPMKVDAAYVTELQTHMTEQVEGLMSGCPSASQVELLKDAETEVEKFVQANTQELAKDKWLCPLSGKKFKGPEFIRKHIFNKHEEKVDEVRKEVQYFNNYLRDPKRPQLPEHPGSSKRPESDSTRGGG